MPGLDVDTYSWLCATITLGALSLAAIQCLRFNNQIYGVPMNTEFKIVPAASSTAISVVLIALLLGVAGLVLAPAFASRNARFQVSSACLRVTGDLYGRLVPAASIQAAALRPIDLAREPQLQPSGASTVSPCRATKAAGSSLGTGNGACCS